MPKKIFELAKELDLGALDLVEKLKSFGFSVRNHMATLSDEEIDKAMGLMKEADPAGKKEVKKKVVKKRAKKKVAAKSSDEAEKKENKKKVVTVRRKTVKKKLVATPSEEVAKETEISDVPAEPTPITTRESAAPVEEGEGSGLRVVHMPEPAAVEAAPVVAEATAEEKSSKEYLKPDKMHTFTPVFIPPEEVAAKKEKTAEAPKKPEAEDPNSKVAGTPVTKAADSKKRLGGLAAMVAKPKVANKARDLVQMRADEELKNYSTAAPGKSLYRQFGKKKIFSGSKQQTRVLGVKDSKRVVGLHKGAKVSELALKLKVKFSELQLKCLELNLLVSMNDFLGMDLCEKVATFYDYRVEDIAFYEEKMLATSEDKDKDKKKVGRNPIITIMGHVDHGKTTLLDYIREAKVASGEAGGITQHIGAYSVQVNDSTLTFLDTPGHAAFGAMRQRGAQVTDLVVLVVAADDGVMPQTKESIRYAQNAGCPIIVAVNKMDKEEANPDRVKQELVEFDLTPEEWGGQTLFIPISALKGDGVDTLLESISLQSEMLELEANPKGRAKGVVIESKIETGRGPICTILVQTGTLKKGDFLVVGETYGRSRSLMDYNGKDLKAAGPSTPVQVLGLNNPPSPGDLLDVVKNEREAKKIVENRINERKALENAPIAEKQVSLEDFFASAQGPGEETKILNLIVRSDVQGSYEAIRSSLECLGNEEVNVKVIGGGVGPITDSDVTLAGSCGGFIFGFNMRPVTSARRLAEQTGVEVKTYSIIYELINDVKLALEGLLDPEEIEVYIGRAEVRETFSIPKIGVIAGSSVIDGKIQRGCNIRLLREGKIVFDGKMSSLKRFKDDVKEVANGYECGIGLENFNDVKQSDLFEAYTIEKKARKLEAAVEATL
ncbi:MAG: translation initiation factor IF-2 [Bacteriovoracaceae bacterium]|jgi:translation initiation factor IF-2|nr:translation initiation factor IF-2 [Bacteriovoracaceae bacterium]